MQSWTRSHLIVQLVALQHHEIRKNNQSTEKVGAIVVENLEMLQGHLRPAFARVLQALQAYAGVLADDKGIKASRRLSAADLLACGEPHDLGIPDPKSFPGLLVRFVGLQFPSNHRQSQSTAAGHDWCPD